LAGDGQPGEGTHAHADAACAEHAPLGDGQRGERTATTAQQQALWDRYDPRSYPFIDFGNRYVITAPIYDPQVLQGKTWSQITSALHNPSSPVAQGAVGAANYITAALCKITGGQPGSVCSSSVMTRLQGAL
jgi:hypothetical protein